MDPLPFSMRDDGVRIAIRLTPRAARAGIEGVRVEADGAAVFRVTVTEPPEDGKANAALVKLLSKAWRLPRTAFDIVQGATDRRKVLRIAGDAGDVRRRLEDWMGKHP